VHEDAEHNCVGFPKIAHRIPYESSRGSSTLVVRNDKNCPSAITVWLLQEVLCHASDTAKNLTSPDLRPELWRDHLNGNVASSTLEIAHEIRHETGPAVILGTTRGHYGESIGWTEIAQRRMRYFGSALNRGTRFSRDVEEQDHVQGLLLMAEIYDVLWPSAIGHAKAFLSEILYRLPVLANLDIDMNQRKIGVEGKLVLSEQQEK